MGHEPKDFEEVLEKFVNSPGSPLSMKRAIAAVKPPKPYPWTSVPAGPHAQEILNNIILTVNEQFEMEHGSSPNIAYNFTEEMDGRHIMQLYCIKPDNQRLDIFTVSVLVPTGQVKEDLSMMMINAIISGVLNRIVRTELGKDYEI